MIKKGDEMTSIILIFIACVATMFAAIYVYSRKEDSAFHALLRESTGLRHQVTKLEEQLQDYKSLSIKNEQLIKCFEMEIHKFSQEVSHLQEHCARIREQQLELRERLAAKRPVIKLTEPIPVQVAPKPPAKLMKKLKTQVKDLSQ